MTHGRTFFTKPEFYQRNYDMGASLRVVPAEIGTDTGSTPGVAIFAGHAHLIAAITAEHGWALSDQLSDALDSHTAKGTTA